jgi:hypothetical protein
MICQFRMFGEIFHGSMEAGIFLGCSDTTLDNLVRHVSSIKDLPKCLNVKIATDEDCINIAAAA